MTPRQRLIAGLVAPLLLGAAEVQASGVPGAPSTLAGGSFADALAVCSTASADLGVRAALFIERGWRQVAGKAPAEPALGDALAIANPPDDGTAAAWAATRAWGLGLVRDGWPAAAVILSEGDSIISLGSDADGQRSTCFLATTRSSESDRFLKDAGLGGTAKDWPLTVRAQGAAVSADPAGRQWHTEISVSAVKPETVPELDTALIATVAASFITRPVR